MVHSFYPQGIRVARLPPIGSLWLALVLSLLACGPKESLHIGPGATLEDIPGHYSIVLGRVEVWLGDTPYLCASPGLSCGLSVRSEEGQGFLIPYSPPTAHWLPGSARSPFFVIRLPDGEYTISHFQGPDGVAAQRTEARSGPTVIDKRFRVKGREVVYIGSLLVRIPADRRGKSSVRVVDDQREAARIAHEVTGAGDVALGTRLMH